MVGARMDPLEPTYQQETYDGTRAGETDQRKGESHQEDAEQTSGGLRLAVDSIGPTAGQRYLKPSKETGGKKQQHQEEENVEDGIRAERIESAGTKDEGNKKTQQNVNDNDADAISNGIAHA